MDRGVNTKIQIHPRERSILSKLSFFYVIKLFVKGYTHGLETTDIYQVLSDSRSESLGNHLEARWKIENKNRRKFPLCRSLWICFWKQLVLLGTIQFSAKLVLTIWSPLALSKLVAFFTPDQQNLTKSDAIYYAWMVIALKTFNVFVFHNLNLALSKLGLAVKAAVVSLIYRKLLKLNSNSLSSVTVGKITTILNKDCEVFEAFIFTVNDVWIGLVQTATVCFMIYNKIGITSLAAVAFFFVVLPLQMYVGKLAYNFRIKCSRRTDERLETIKEVLSAIKIVKMYVWEQYFEEKIDAKRKLELNELLKLFYSKVIITTIASISSKVVLFIFVITYIWSGRDVTAEIVYYIVSCITDIENSLSDTLPSGLSKAAETYATIKRCESILGAQEMIPNHELKQTVCEEATIIFNQVSVQHHQTKVLENISLRLKKGLHAVVGHVGSGKTTFLKSILHELEITGQVQVSGRVSYAAQNPWLFPGTIKNNILFGQEYCKKRYEEVLNVTCLEYDLKVLEHEDGAIVGEQGLNLSKGQQARVNLARALYAQTDIYLLDDCLASLDAHVGNYIFEHAIRKFLHNKLCVFVTNDRNHIQESDCVIKITNNSVHVTENVEVTRGNTFRSDHTSTNEQFCHKTPIYSERKNAGKVSLTDYCKYIGYGGGVPVLGAVVALFIATQTCASLSEKFMSKWVTAEQNSISFKNISDEGRSYNFNIYLTVVVLYIILNLIKSFAYFAFVRWASLNLHKAMLRCVLYSTMRFFDCTYIGTILTRFSKDCVTVDEYVAFVFMECLNVIFVVFGGIILLTSVSVVFLVESCILLLVAYLVKRFCQPTGRNLQRLHVIARSPMVGHVNSTLEGLSTIRASGVEEIITKEFDEYQDVFTSAHYMLNTSLIALSYILELFSVLFIASIITQFLISESATNVGDVGLAITQSFTISQIITNGVRSISDCENLMTSVERMLEYTVIDEEPKAETTPITRSLGGTVDFNQVSLSYGELKMLSYISFNITENGKLGIVGRTGAGKSSIISSLLRLYQIQGHITIDGIDIKNLPLCDLRSQISVIPQIPFIFTGTIRENLDPLNQHPDHRIWNVLNELHLTTLVDDLSLEIDKSFQLSVGQKQLLSLARVILRQSKIVVFDEATADVDPDTEILVQKIITKYFNQCTLIIIAHRLTSVLMCDKVIVLNRGQICEFDTPENLWKNRNSFFHKITN